SMSPIYDKDTVRGQVSALPIAGAILDRRLRGGESMKRFLLAAVGTLTLVGATLAEEPVADAPAAVKADEPKADAPAAPKAEAPKAEAVLPPKTPALTDPSHGDAAHLLNDDCCKHHRFSAGVDALFLQPAFDTNPALTTFSVTGTSSTTPIPGGSIFDFTNS